MTASVAPRPAAIERAPEVRSPTGAPFSPAEFQALVPLPAGPGESVPHAIGPPPPRGGRVERAELLTLHALEAKRTPEGDAWARRLDDEGSTKIWRDEARRLRGEVGLGQALKGAAMLATTVGTSAAVTQVEKHRYDRQRPFEVDPTLTTVVPDPGDDSYPSGRSSNAFAAARILSAYNPDDAQRYYQIAQEIAWSRVYAGVHFPSDVAAGAFLGTSVALGALGLIGK